MNYIVSKELLEQSMEAMDITEVERPTDLQIALRNQINTILLEQKPLKYHGPSNDGKYHIYFVEYTL